MFTALVAFLIAQRLFELMLAEKNRRWSLARGGVESGQRHYYVIVGMHSLYYASLIIERDYFSRTWSPAWPLLLGILVLAQALRIWVIVTLGPFWNTRIIVIPGRNLVRNGPYRFVRHPNYVVVSVELAAVALLCDAYLTALCFTVANAFVLRIRIREEELALARSADAYCGKLPRFIPRSLRIGEPRDECTSAGRNQ